MFLSQKGKVDAISRQFNTNILIQIFQFNILG